MTDTPTLLSRDWLASRLMDLCASDTTSGLEDLGLPTLRALLAELGAEVTEQSVAPGRTNVLATWPANGDGPRVLFSTHLDTVPPFIAPRREGDRIHGRGTCDAKGQILAQLAAIHALRGEGIEGLAWLGVVGEETDSAGARAALSLPMPELRALINGEPTGNKLATGQRGALHLHLACRGVAAHSGSPELGRNAIWELTDWMQRLRAEARPTDPMLGPEVWNLGRMSGGDAPNVVPARAEAEVLARTLPGSDFADRVAALRPEHGDIAVRLSEPPDRYPVLNGFPMAPMPFGSDAPTLRALVPDRTVVLAGPGHITTAHTEDEHLDLDDLEAGIALNRRLAMHFLGSHGGEGSKR
ncbi:MAG TPA: M20/M25/M40 family metallo-hydrolase [Holophagaceae bacterium]|nr:M20/M25/M40 family metallo-hydrolase [Holophagaceae bacterium]